MKRVSTLLLPACAVCLFALTARSSAQAPVSPKVPEHDILAREAGTWTAEMTMWPGGPEGPSMTMAATETNTLLGDGLWLISEFDCKSDQFSFSGHGQFGYDVQRKKFVGTWIDTMASHISPMEGTYDKDAGEMTMFGTSRNPHTGEEMKTKSVSKMTDEDHRIFTMYDEKADGIFVKSLEIKYTRASKGE